MLVFPVATSAITVEEIQAQIKTLLAQVAELTQQLHAIQVSSDITQTTSTEPSGGFGAKHRICNVLSRSLSEGSEGDDVLGLQEFLQAEGLFSAVPTGFFGPITAAALKQWQARENIVSQGTANTTGWGVFGPKTRNKIMFWCNEGGTDYKEKFTAVPSVGTAPLTVTFNTWLSGFRINSVSYSIDFGDGTSERAADCSAPAGACVSPGENVHTYTKDGTYTALLIQTTDPCVG